jgi:hypothetical protein
MYVVECKREYERLLHQSIPVALPMRLPAPHQEAWLLRGSAATSEGEALHSFRGGISNRTPRTQRLPRPMTEREIAMASGEEE